MVYKVADNILSPLGVTTAENYQAVKACRSALKRHDQRWSLPDKVLTASLFSKEQEQQFLISGLSRFESMVVTSAREALSQTTIDVSQPNVILIISTTKGDVELLEESLDSNILFQYPFSCGQRPAYRKDLGFHHRAHRGV